MGKLFYDTNAILDYCDEIFSSDERFYISSVTLNELENIKSSGSKDEDIKYKARKVLHKLEENSNYDIVLYQNHFFDVFSAKYDYPMTPDSKIISCVFYKMYEGENDITFVTNDLACKELAKAVGVKVDFKSSEYNEEYTGFIEITPTDEEFAELYTTTKNKYNLLTNQYLIVNYKDQYGKDMKNVFKWNGHKYTLASYNSIDTKMIGKVKPKDAYQIAAFDSLNNNQITVLRGKAGTGKSLIGLGYLLDQLERNKIDRIIIFVNPVAAKDCGKMGFLPGDRDEKMLDSQIGNFLIGKLGGLDIVYQMIQKEKLLLMPMADCRGLDTSGMNAGIMMTESQNTNKDIMKLFLQRIGEDCICVIDGDDQTQRDMASYNGNNNGLTRLSQIFRGEPYYGEVTLQNCYRSRIAERAEFM